MVDMRMNLWIHCRYDSVSTTENFRRLGAKGHHQVGSIIDREDDRVNVIA